MKKSKLIADFEYDFALWGIISSLKEYKLAWHINKSFGIRLVKDDDINLEFISKDDLIISNYTYLSEYSEFRLLKNKSIEGTGKNAYILPELEKFDYLILIKGEDPFFEDGTFKKNIMDIPNIQYLQKFEPTSIKSRENLIF
jgi:hypothetical protein